MDGFELFSQIAFGTTIDPKQKRRRINKLQNQKRNRKRRFEEAEREKKEEQKQQAPDDGSTKSESDSSEDETELQTSDKVTGRAGRKKKRLSVMQMYKIRQEEVTHFRRKHRIYTTGDDIPDPFENFDQLTTDYKVDLVLLENISKLGYLKPTPIQMQAIPLMLHNRQILACAPTGSGKTAAFLIPLIYHLKAPEKGGVRAVIVAPTRELSKQIHSFCVQMSEGTGLRPLIIENVNAIKCRPKHLKKHDILISTPNRLIYLLKEDPPSITLNNVKWLIVDECDKLFEVGKKGFRDQLAVIYNACNTSEVKRAMYSATFSNEVEKWCKLNFDSLVSVSIGTKNTSVESVKQELLFVGSEGGKLLAVQNLLREGFMPPVLIFVQEKERAKDLHKEMSYLCTRVKAIHADLAQEERDSVVQQFIEGKVWVLICTELMARGIDFKGIKLVINYDFPSSAISYIHRIGRTGRAGEEGKAVTYFTTDDVENLKSIAQVIKNAGCEVPAYIMGLKTAKKKNNEPIRQVKRQKICNAPTYDMKKQSRRKPLLKWKKNFRKSKKSQA